MMLAKKKSNCKRLLNSAVLISKCQVSGNFLTPDA